MGDVSRFEVVYEKLSEMRLEDQETAILFSKIEALSKSAEGLQELSRALHEIKEPPVQLFTTT